jgi:prepilin-type N-terminal cleavage/methylation domain-containing protein
MMRKGYTLVEAMIVVAILGMFVVMLPNLYKQTRRFFFLSSTKTELQRDARSVMILLTKRMRQARSTTITIDQDTSQPYYSRLSFYDVDGNYIRYYQSGKRLFYVDVSTRTLTDDLRYLAFSLPRSDELGIVSVSFTLEKSIYEGQTKAIHMASERVRIMNQ